MASCLPQSQNDSGTLLWCNLGISKLLVMKRKTYEAQFVRNQLIYLKKKHRKPSPGAAVRFSQPFSREYFSQPDKTSGASVVVSHHLRGLDLTDGGRTNKPRQGEVNKHRKTTAATRSQEVSSSGL